ncbi:MAG: hypothetical protein ACRD1R_13470 [Acidobacteriota bacterium]
MTTKRVSFILAAAFLLAASLLTAHPHFRKTVDASTRDMEVKVQYTTYPYNEAHLDSVEDGFIFNCGNATLSIAKGNLTAGGQALAAGNYLLRARAKNTDDWTLLLVPEAQAGDPRNPDLSNAIELQTVTLTGQPTTHHLSLDLHGGHGPTDGKLVLSLLFGPRTLETGFEL